MTMTGMSCAATSLAIAGSRCRPQTSLTIAAPWSSAQAAMAAFMRVDRHRQAELDHRRQHRREPRQLLVGRHRLARRHRAASIPRRCRGCRRRSAMRCGWAIAVAGSRKRPPSEKESGVTLRMPMTSGRRSASRPASQDGGEFGGHIAGGLRFAMRAHGRGFALEGVGLSRSLRGRAPVTETIYR